MSETLCVWLIGLVMFIVFIVGLPDIIKAFRGR